MSGLGVRGLGVVVEVPNTAQLQFVLAGVKTVQVWELAKLKYLHLVSHLVPPNWRHFLLKNDSVVVVVVAVVVGVVVEVVSVVVEVASVVVEVASVVVEVASVVVEVASVVVEVASVVASFKGSHVLLSCLSNPWYSLILFFILAILAFSKTSDPAFPGDESPPIIAIVAAKLKLYSHLCQLLNHWNLIILNSPVCKAFCKVF